MVRVCVVTDGLPPYYGGAQRRAFRHAQHLQSIEGLEAMLIGWVRPEHCFENSDFPSFVYPVRLRNREFHGLHSPSKVAKSLLHLVEIEARLGQLLFRLRHEIDVIHVINAAPWFNLLVVPVARFLNIPVILEMVLVGGDDPLTLNRRGGVPEEQLFPHRPLKFSLFSQADAYVSKSRPLSEAYQRAGLPDSKLFQIASGVNTEKFKPPTARQRRAVRQKLGLKPEEIIILFVGAVEERKGPHRLLDAFREVATQHPRVRLLVVGPSEGSRFDSTYVSTLYENRKRWGLSGRVTFVNRVVDNVHEYMRASDIFALPSSHEGFSMAILEAMSSGMAIVASNIPEVAGTQIEHGSEGLLVPVCERSRLVDSLRRLAGNSELRVRLGRAARERALREFKREVIYERYLQLYERWSNEKLPGA